MASTKRSVSPDLDPFRLLKAISRIGYTPDSALCAPIGSEAAGAAFKDTWTLSDVDEAWHGEIADREPTLYAIVDAAGLSQ